MQRLLLRWMQKHRWQKLLPNIESRAVVNTLIEHGTLSYDESTFSLPKSLTFYVSNRVHASICVHVRNPYRASMKTTKSYWEMPPSNV